jgi:hypothetical protein
MVSGYGKLTENTTNYGKRLCTIHATRAIRNCRSAQQILPTGDNNILQCTLMPHSLSPLGVSAHLVKLACDISRRRIRLPT